MHFLKKVFSRNIGILLLISFLFMDFTPAKAQSWNDVGSQPFTTSDFLYRNYPIALDADGSPYVAYENLNGRSLKATVLKFNGTEWVAVGSPNGFSDSTAWGTSISMDENTPYVVFQDGAHNGSVTVMKYNGNTI